MSSINLYFLGTVNLNIVPNEVKKVSEVDGGGSVSVILNETVFFSPVRTEKSVFDIYDSILCHDYNSDP